MDNSYDSKQESDTQTPSAVPTEASSESTSPETSAESTPEIPKEINQTITEEVTESASHDLNEGSSTASAVPVSISEPAVMNPSTPAPISVPKKTRKLPLLILIVLLFLAAAGTGGYMLGKNKNQASQTATTMNKNDQALEQELTIPEGATVIAQCAKGRGIQYALPKDIPLGPVYNVYEGKVIGIEFMVGKDDLLGAAKNYLNLPLSNKKYDHVNIGLLSQGHAGFPLPHYHVDIMMVPTSVTDKITCT